MNLLLLQNKTTAKHLLLLLFCFAILFGPAYTLFDSYNYDTVANPDLESYLGIAHFDFNQSPIRKYRVIVPLLASGIHYVFGPVFSSLAPYTFPGPDFSLCFSFLIVNCLFMSIFGLLVYQYCKAYGVSTLGALVGLLSVLTCRWASYIAGLPLVDSLYLVVIGMTLLGIKTKNSKLIFLAIFIGPWAKESFVFVAPLIFFFSSVSKPKQLVWFILSGVLVFSFRYYLDTFSDTTTAMALKNDLSLVSKIPDSLRRLFSFHGLYELTAVVGPWGLLFISLLHKKIRMLLKQKTTLYMGLFLLIVLLHALLSNELARMFYLAAPITAVWLALITDEIVETFPK